VKSGQVQTVLGREGGERRFTGAPFRGGFGIRPASVPHLPQIGSLKLAFGGITLLGHWFARYL
jgi:hypothetical protein